MAAGKTGTTENSADAWFCGFDPLLATAVWMGYPEAEIPMPGVQGATYCVPIWGTYYNLVFGSTQIADFTRPARMPHYRPWHGSHAASAPAPTFTTAPTPTAPGPGTLPSQGPTPTQPGSTASP